MRALWMFAVSMAAHEIGTTRVVAEIGDQYKIEITTDAASLDEKLASFGRFEEAYPRRMKVLFDGVAVQPSIAREGDVIRLTGAVPEGARSFSMKNGWNFATYSLTVNGVTGWVEGSEVSKEYSLAAPAKADIVRQYLWLGFTHIVPLGLDHVLFVLGLYLLSGTWRSVLWQVSAFTVAHTITLALSILGVIAVRAEIVEPLIAVSIAYVAVENVLHKELKAWRIALVFGFGLLHGMGFAGVLQELGLPRGEFVTALLSFNIGVEFGQLFVVAAAFALIGWRWSQREWYRARVVVPASVAIACVAVYWTAERLILSRSL
jgi:hydrogenase/urease accessory protein HupE